MKKKILYILIMLIALAGCSNDSGYSGTITKNSIDKDYVDNNGTIHVIIHGAGETVYTPDSSWIDYIEYYKDSKHMIMHSDGTSYVHANVSSSLWNKFKNADSYGSFYNKNFKNNSDYWVVGYNGNNGNKIKVEYQG